jgi:type IV pilus assembly protein PilQ
VIDVKAVSVVDLLRFIADQVGVNLYVDPSVGDDLRATYKFRNIPWDQALDIILKNANLDKEFSNGVLRVATVEKFRLEEEQRAELRTQRELSVPPETVTFPLSYAKVEEVVPIISQYLSPRGTVLQDVRTNTLIIEDIPKKMTAIRALIRKLDRMISQVTIEARVVETNKRFLRELGIQWGLSADYSPEIGTDTGLQFPNRIGVGGPSVGLADSPGGLQGGYAVNFPTVAENPSGIGLTLGNFLDNFKLDISLQMLESDGYGQIISAPKVTTQNNKTATIQNGQRIPIQTIQRGLITTTYVNAVLELQVTPHITAEETIIMDIIVDKSEPDFTRTVFGNPVINIRKAETRVLVKNGGTAVIGGIFTTNEQNASEGIPTLRKVPLLKRLFGSELKQYNNQELLIFVTPRIVKY